MWFRRLEIRDLRNLVQVDLDPGPRLNYFFGENGAGKTAILEAVHLLARGRSFRTHQAADLVRQGCQTAIVHATVSDEHRGLQSIGLSRGRTGNAELRINGQHVRRLSEAAELLPLQVMVPSLSDLVFGPPGGRRQWLDWGVFHVEQRYLRALRAYLQAMRQRNAALKQLSAGELRPADVLVWSEEMATQGEAIAAHRQAYLDSLAPMAAEMLADLAPELSVEIHHQRGWPADRPLRKVLGEIGPREVKSGSSQSGPHRADVELTVSGMSAGACLSRGQGKALASALMLAQAKLLQQRARRSSAFLIDDIGAELDLPHSERFFDLLATLGAQILATSNSRPTVLSGLPEADAAVFHVEHGRVRRVSTT